MDLNENIAKSEELQRDSNEAGLNFIFTELDTSLTFAKLAQDAGPDADKKLRNQANARQGYDTILRCINRFDASQLSATDISVLNDKFAALKAALEQLGENLSH